MSVLAARIKSEIIKYTRFYHLLELLIQ